MLQLRLPLPRFVSAGEIFAGSGSLGALRALNAAKAIVLASPSVLAKHAVALERSIGAESVTLVEMPRGEPTMANLKPVMAELERFRPDWIIAVGGGSVIDGAKIAWVRYEHPGLELERLTRAFGVPALRGKARFVAAPTTAGTGSEASSSALLIDETGAKHAMTSHELLPDIAVLDPRLAVGCPPSVIAHAGLDALAHAIESYVSKLENTLADALAEKAASELFDVLPLLWNAPGDEALALRALNASLLAGWGQNQKIPGIGHAVAHQLGGLGVKHGQATGRLLAPSMRFNVQEDSVRKKYDQLGARVGLSNASGLIDHVASLLQQLQVETLPDKVYSEQESIITGALEDPCARFNPREVNAEAVKVVLEGAR